MTVKRITPQGYIMCWWHEPDGRYQEKMFFPEMLVLHDPNR